jgi:hypothetical protein
MPGLEGDKEEPAIGVRNTTQQAVTDNRRNMFNAGRLQHNLLDLPAGLVSPLEGGSIGQLDAGINITLILLRKKAAGDLPT